MIYLLKCRLDYFEKDIQYTKDNNDFKILKFSIVFGGTGKFYLIFSRLLSCSLKLLRFTRIATIVWICVEF